MCRSLPASILALAMLTSGCLPIRPEAATATPVPGLEVSVAEAFYGVGGVDAHRLNLELFRRGPRHAGVAWQGLTDFRVVYSYLPEPDADGCRAARPRVSVRAITTLPRWTDRDDAPAALRGDWDLFLRRLRDHEEGHRRIAIGVGADLLQEVAALEAPDCEALERSALAVAASYQASVTLEQQGWDAETRHGLEGGE